MTGEIVNLRREKKRRARRAAQDAAAEQRVRHGRTEEQKIADKQALERDHARHDSHRIDRPS